MIGEWFVTNILTGYICHPSFKVSLVPDSSPIYIESHTSFLRVNNLLAAGEYHMLKKREPCMHHWPVSSDFTGLQNAITRT